METVRLMDIREHMIAASTASARSTNQRNNGVMMGKLGTEASVDNARYRWMVSLRWEHSTS